MKNRGLFKILIICSILIGITVFYGCSNGNSPEKLDTPIVTLENNIARWNLNEEADKFEISINGELSYLENVISSKELTNGQTFKIRAIGDGVKFINSEWSNTVEYNIMEEHKCDFTGEWKTDETHHWHECSCGKTDTKVEHSGGTATTTEKAKCEVCGTSYGELKQPEEHKCDFTGEWKTDGTHHWHECSCGKTDTKVAHSGGTATCTQKPKCEVCGKEYGSVLEHQYTELKHDDTKHWYECSCGEIKPNSTENHKGGQATTLEKAKCEVCNTPYGELLPPTHECDFTGEWKTDETHHWHECSCGETDTKVEHSGGTATTTEKAKCEVCGASYGELKQPEEHKCDFTGEWKHDDTHHWHECSCGKTDTKVAHSGGTATTTEKAKCEVCGTSYGELKQPDPTPTTAPTYLGIMASNTVPTEADAPVRMMMMSARYVSLEDALRAYLTDSNNSLGETLPSASDYPLYSLIGQTVYIQIWLDNPDQNTILSLKLNGVKYQAGGALQSFFVQDSDTYLNCVYVAVTIPADSYKEITYEVTEIEYVEGSNVSQDGKAVLIDENNDTVTIGLPFEEALPTVSISNIDSTATTITFDVNVSDEDGYVELVDGWLRVVIYNNNNEIIGQSKLTLGNNSVTFENLSADTPYSIMAFVLGDAHDSNGVYVHGLANERARTKSVISCELESEILYNEETNKYYPKIKVNATLADTSFTFTKVEVIRDYSTVVFTADFDGSIEITENILNSREYIVKVYYKNSLNVEQSYQDYVYVDGLDYPNINFDSHLSYGLVDDVIMGFECSDGKYNIDNLTVKIFDEKSAQYIAESALYLLDNPTAIQDLETLYNNSPFGSEEWAEAYDRWYKLSNIQETIDQYHSTLNRTDWENALAKGIYLYEFTYGVDEEFFKGANNRYYVILPDYQAKRIHDNSWQYIITGEVDNNDEQEVVDRQLSSGWFEINPALTKNDYLFAEYSNELGKDLFYIDENNVLYLQTMSRNNLGDETHRALGYVNQIVLRTREKIIKVLWTGDAADTNIDEEAWLEAMKVALIAGEDPNSVFPLGDLEPITFDIDDIDLSDVAAGSYSICFTYKMYGKEYTEEHPYDTDGGWLDYKLVGQLPKASIDINTSTENYGGFDIVFPESLNNGYWYNYTIEVRDESENLIGTYNQDNYYEIGNLKVNYSIRIKLDVFENYDYYTEGEWSEWFICSAAKCNTPTELAQEYETTGVKVSWSWIDGAEKYIYIVNNGEEQETTETSVSGLKDGDTIKVKAVPVDDGSSLASDYSEVYTVEDTRTPLTAPVVTFDSTRGYLNWEAVENAARYEVYDVTNGITIRTVTTTTCRITTGCVYIVKALPEDFNTYIASQSEEINTSVKLDTPQITISETGVVSFSEYHNIKGNITYVYVINNGEEQTSDNAYDVVTLNANDTIKVKVVCDATGYVESDWATATYEVEVGGTEPAHIETTIEELVSNKPTEEKTVIYEVTAFWILKDGGATYGNGWLNDGNGNEVYVYGLCSDSSVLTYENGAYTYQNNQSYSSLNLVTGSIIKVGMVYSLQYDNYMAYVIEIVDLVETVQIETLNSNFDEYTNNQVAVTGIVYAADKNGLFIMDNSGNSLYVFVGYSDVSLGQTVTFTGVTYQYYSLPEFKCVTYTRGEIVEYDLTLYSGTISRFIEVNNPQFEKVFTHNVYRLTGILIQDGNDYYLTYDQDRIQIKSSTLDNDYTNLNNYIGQNISINVVLVDYHSTLEVFRVIPLVGEEANIEIAINKLAAPVLTINESGLVSWEAIENAIMYEYIINEGITYVTDDLSVQLSQGDTIYVRALGDGDNYTSSDYSSISYLAQSLTIGQINENFDAYTETQVQVSGTVFARDLYGFFIIDENQDTLYIKYNYGIDDIKISQFVTVKGSTYAYYSLPQFVATEVICGDIVTFDMNLYTGTIEEIIAAVSDSSSMVYDHYVFRVTGDLVREGDDYFLVDGDYKLQVKSSMWDVEYNILTPNVDKNISVNVVLYDHFSTTSIFRVIPLPGSDMNVEIHVATQGKCDTPVLSISETGLVTWEAVEHAVQYMYKINNGSNQSTQNLSIQLSLGDTIVIKAMSDGTYTSSDWSEPITYVDLNAEPEHIETTVANLVNNLPTEEKTVIYEVTAYWTLKDGGSTYGNGWLHDGQGNQITVYGLCASDSVLTWSNGAYTYQNDKSYSSTGINDGDMITVGMVYSVQYDNYMCYLIEIIDNSTDKEPEHIETTVANLVNNLPTEEKTVIYEVTAYWTLKDGGSTYGNGWLHDGQGNQITVYGLCASDSVLTWSNGAYTYQNDKSYSSTGINDGDMITVGMVYSVQYDNYMCYLIEIVEEAGSQTYIDINFIMINDTHGAFTDSSEGNSIGRIDTLVESLEAANGDYIFIHNGDAFQGSYVCGETYGLAMIEALNDSGVDCFVIGNHEFDWGIDKIAAYRDGDLTNGEANFPFLGANIYYKGTTTRPEWLDAYTIIEQDGVKVGIIGIMGPDQETSILNRYVKDYDFVEPLEIVQSTSAYLRDTFGCDVVVVAAHDYNSSMNSQFAQLSGSSRIDAIFCAHTHQNIYETLTRSDSKVIPVVQCNHKNVNAAEVILKVNEEFEYTSHSATKHQIANMYTNPTTYYYEISTDVQTIIDSYQDLIDESNEVIGTVSGGLTNSTLGAYAVDAMLNYVYSSYEFEGIDMAIMNTGGVRASIDSGDITRAEVFEVFPFNNAVVLVDMSGALIKEFYGNNSGYMYMDMDDSISSYTDLDDDTIYQLAVIDYVFENTRYEDQFGTLSDEDYIQTDIILRDLLMNYLDAAY